MELEIGVRRKTKAEGKQSNLELLEKYVGALRAKLQDADLDVAGLQLLGMVEAEAERGGYHRWRYLWEVLQGNRPRDGVPAGGVLWNDRRADGLIELAWRAEIGVIIGILFVFVDSIYGVTLT